MYKSPIEIIQSDIETKIENNVYEAVQKVGINVNKEELIKALSYDRYQYEKGYNDAISDLSTHAHWIDRNGACIYTEWTRYKCSNCEKCGIKSNYCGNCGAKMDEE